MGHVYILRYFLLSLARIHPYKSSHGSASECIAAPVDPLRLSQAVGRIVRLTGNNRAQTMHRSATFSFAGMSFQRERYALVADDGSSLELTSSEGRLLAHFLSRPWTLCS